jgi:hypothetical protein
MSLPWRSRSQYDLQQNRVRPITYLKLDFTTISQKWSPYWDGVSRATFGSLPWMSRSQHDLAAKSYRPITLLFEVGFYKYFTEMITILRRRVARKFGLFFHFELGLWHYSDTTRGISSCVQNLFGEHHPVQPALVSCIMCWDWQTCINLDFKDTPSVCGPVITFATEILVFLMARTKYLTCSIV